MIKRWSPAMALLALTSLLALGSDPAAALPVVAPSPAEEAAEAEAMASGLEAFLYGYPRVELWRPIQNETRRVSADQMIFAPPNRFYRFERLARLQRGCAPPYAGGWSVPLPQARPSWRQPSSASPTR